jgi:hypothetical protein
MANFVFQPNRASVLTPKFPKIVLLIVIKNVRLIKTVLVKENVVKVDVIGDAQHPCKVSYYMTCLKSIITANIYFSFTPRNKGMTMRPAYFKLLKESSHALIQTGFLKKNF